MKSDKSKIFKAKLFRWLGVTKPIELSEPERKWIKLIKGHYKNEYFHTGHEWTDVLKPMFRQVYGWTAEDHYQDFLSCMFTKLLEIHLKIKDDKSGHERQLYSIFSASFYKSISREQELPIERAVSELCGLIQGTKVIENGVPRFIL